MAGAWWVEERWEGRWRVGSGLATGPESDGNGVVVGFAVTSDQVEFVPAAAQRSAVQCSVSVVVRRPLKFYRSTHCGLNWY